MYNNINYLAEYFTVDVSFSLLSRFIDQKQAITKEYEIVLYEFFRKVGQNRGQKAWFWVSILKINIHQTTSQNSNVRQ